MTQEAWGEMSYTPYGELYVLDTVLRESETFRARMQPVSMVQFSQRQLAV